MKSTPAAAQALKAQLDEVNEYDDFSWRITKVRCLLEALTSSQNSECPEWMEVLPRSTRSNVMECIRDLVADLERVHNEAHP